MQGSARAHDVMCVYNSLVYHYLVPVSHTPGLLVDDARQAFEAAVAHGAKAARAPTQLQEDGAAGGAAVVSEVELYGDVVLRFISGDCEVKQQKEEEEEGIVCVSGLFLFLRG